MHYLLIYLCFKGAFGLHYVRTSCMGTSSSDKFHHIRFETLLGEKLRCISPSVMAPECFYHLLCVYTTE